MRWQCFAMCSAFPSIDFVDIQVKYRTNTHKLISEPTPKYKQLLVRKMWAQKQKGPEGSRGSPLPNVQISI